MNPIIADDFKVEVDRGEVLRLLGVPKRTGDRALNAPPQAIDLYPLVLEEALSLVRPKAVYAVFPTEEVPYNKVFKRASSLGFAVCTIGPLVETEAARCSSGGESLKGLLLDAIGSVAVESVVEDTAGRIRMHAAGRGAKAGVRFSPGYGAWPLEWQRDLFGIVDGSMVGVKLNDSCIMEPRKSVSFAVRIGAAPDAS